MAYSVLKALVLPPGCLFLLGALGLFLARRRPRLGRGLCVGAAVALYLLCTPVVASLLRRSLEGEPWRPGDEVGAGAIVVLGGDHDPHAPEYGGETVGELTLQRLRYAARLQRATGLPILVAGGRPRRGREPLAETMARVLREELGAEVRWIEGASADTSENAARSARLLLDAGVGTALIVTHAWHEPRALAAFAGTGLAARPAPTVFRSPPLSEPTEILPSARALLDSTHAAHEWLGRAWYALGGS